MRSRDRVDKLVRLGGVRVRSLLIISLCILEFKFYFRILNFEGSVGIVKFSRC